MAALTLPVISESDERCVSEDAQYRQLVRHQAHVVDARDDLLDQLLVLRTGDLTGQQHLAVVAGHVDVHPVAQVFVDAADRTQLDALVLELGSGCAPVGRHQRAHRSATQHDRRAGAEHAAQAGHAQGGCAKPDRGRSHLHHHVVSSCSPSNWASTASHMQCKASI
jgi:hypothetical protein